MTFNSIVKFTIIILLSVTTALWGQSNEQIKELDSIAYSNNLMALNVKFGDNKTIPADIELATLAALSYFPELKNTKIRFKKAKIKTSLNAQPTLLSLLFRRKSKRKYIIRYADNDDSTKVLFKNTSFNAQVGVIGHELNHLVDFSSKNLFGVIGRGFSYASKKKKERFEKQVDQMTIEKGLGWQLYAWAVFILDGDTATEEYKAF